MYDIFDNGKLWLFEWLHNGWSKYHITLRIVYSFISYLFIDRYGKSLIIKQLKSP